MCFEVDYDGLVAWGTLIGGIGTAGAFLIAGYAFLVNAKANRSTQARLIHAHMPKKPHAFDISLSGYASIGLEKYADTVVDDSLVSYSEDLEIDDNATVIMPSVPNLSTEFIFEIELTVFGNGQKWAKFETPTLPPGDTAEFLGVLAPDHRSDAAITFTVEFTDAIGKRWTSRSGHVVRLKRRLRDRAVSR